jgi:hypothetical protein
VLLNVWELLSLRISFSLRRFVFFSLLELAFLLILVALIVIRKPFFGTFKVEGKKKNLDSYHF